MNDTNATIQPPSAVPQTDPAPVDLVSRIDMLVRAYAMVEESGASGSLDSRVRDDESYDNSPLEELRHVKVMIVDDDISETMRLERRLREAGCQNVTTAKVARRSIEQMLDQRPDLLLLDLKAPEFKGLEILWLKQATHVLDRVPTLVLADAACSSAKRQALRLGATDFLGKPVDLVEVAPRVLGALGSRGPRRQDEPRDSERTRLEDLVRRRTDELEHSRQQLILSLARAAEHRDNETGNHVIRVGRFAGVVARELGWPDERVTMLEQAAQLHDVGKIGVPDSILFKPGKLDPQEYELIKRHCAWGKEIIEPYSSREFQMLKSHARLGEAILHVRTSPMLMMASRIAQTHHENWDGTGYPLGLAGEDIPIEGRVTAVADVFDALSSKRPYKDPFPREKCFEILAEQRGSKFDPDVLDAFFRRADEIVQIQLDLMEDDGDLVR